MKKLLSVLCCLTIILTLASCGKKKTGTDASAPNTGSTTTQTPGTTTQQPVVPEPDPEPVMPEPAANVDPNDMQWDLQLEAVVHKYKDVTDLKYGRIVTRFKQAYTHPMRNQETELGRLFSDIFKDSLGLDLVFVGSGSIRGEILGPIVQLQELMEIFPYNDEIYRVYVTGAQLRRMVKWILRDEAWEGHTEFYQFSHGFRVVYSRSKGVIESMELDGKPVEDDQRISLGLPAFHFANMDTFLNVSRDEVEENGKIKAVTTNCFDTLNERLSQMELVTASEEPRLILKD